MTKLLVGLVCLFCLTFSTNLFASDYDVAAFFKGMTPAEGTKVQTEDDELKDAKLILVPVNIEAGTYVLKVTRKSQDLYKVDDKNIYIQTKFCFEFSFSQEAILKVDGNLGFTKGKINFTK